MSLRLKTNMRKVEIPPSILAKMERSANLSNVKRSQMSAGVLHDGIIVGCRANVKLEGRKERWTLHAEERLLASRHCAGETIVVFRSNGSGSSKPCRRCAFLLKEARVRRVIYKLGKEWIQESVGRL